MAAKKRRTKPIKVLAPKVVPMSNEDYEQAVTALAAMIGDWWNREQQRREGRDRNDHSGTEK